MKSKLHIKLGAAESTVKRKANARTQKETCEMFSTYEMVCPLCGLTIPPNTPHKCERARG